MIISVQAMLGKDNTEQVRQCSDLPFSLLATCLISCKELSFRLSTAIFC